MLYSGALSGIIVILGMLGILYCINRRICKPKSKHVKTSKADILQPAEHEIQDTLELHERLYEEIDESKFESILHSPTCSPNLNKVDGSLGVDSASNCNLNTINKSLGQENGNSQKAVSLLKTFNKGIVVQSSFCYPVIEEDLSSSESREDCDYDRTSYLHPYNILSAKRSSNSNSTVESNYDRTSYLHPYNTLSEKRLHYHTPERVTNAVQSKKSD